MTMVKYRLTGRTVVALSKPRYVAGGYLITVTWETDDARQILPDGTIHPAHRHGFYWEEPICNLTRL
jgi:hypothetical protein